MFVTPVGVLDGSPVGLFLYGRHQRGSDSVVFGAARVARARAVGSRVPRLNPFRQKVPLQVPRSGAET